MRTCSRVGAKAWSGGQPGFLFSILIIEKAK
jgi:hypothetical protein